MQTENEPHTSNKRDYLNIKTPILLIGFNRPDTTQQAIDKIRAVQPAKLYVAVDGPRYNKPGEAELVKSVRQIVQQIDWPCNVKYLFRENNLGCKLGVTSAISWALTNEDRIIIIEDDIVAAPSFFYFAEVLLEKYKDDHRIAMISANNYTPINSVDSDYLLSKYGHIWGWATWKRVWAKFDVDIPYLKRDIENNHLKTLGLPNDEMRYLRKYAKNILFLIENDKINTWDYQFAYYRVRNNLLSIVPRINLASNIGTSSSRTDSVNASNENYYPADDSFVLLKHPTRVEHDKAYDHYHFKKHLNKRTPFITRVHNKIIRTLKLK